MQPDRFNNGKYVNWVKTSLSLLYLKEGITKFSDEKADVFHKDVTQHVRQRSTKAVTTQCTNCTHKSAIKTKKNTAWRIDCIYNVCSVWLEEILPYHLHKPLPNIAWANSNPQLWPSDVWELAKLFQPYGCESHKNAEDSDCTALLTMMLNCTFFHTFLTNTARLQEIKDVRNACMHSKNQEIDDQDMTKALDLMVALLEEPSLKNRQECIEAKTKIVQLRDNILELCLNKDLELRALNNRVAAICSDMDRLDAEYQQVKSDMANITDRQDSTVDEYNQLRDQMAEVRQEITEITKKWESIEQTHDPSLGVKMEDLTSRLRDLETKCREDYKRVLENVQSTMAIFEARLHDIETQKAEKKQTGEDTLLTDTQKHLISLYDRHNQKVPVYPLRPEDREHVEQLYVKPSMEEMNPQGMRGLIEQGNDTKKEVKLKDIRDIFFSDEKSFKNIYLVAEGGSGKSTLCEFLVYLWVKENSAKENKGERGFMEEFALLFYISLREANSDSTSDIEDMIRAQLELNLDEEDMSTLILQYTCLIILDGLDEYSLKHPRGTRNISASLPWRRHSAKCTILTTSRPWKLELLASELGGHIDRQIRITGLESESQEDLAKIVITLLNSKREHVKNFKDFISDMKKQQLDKYMETPILLLQMLGLWFDGESFGNSQCEIYAKIIEQQIKFVAEVKNNSAASRKGLLHKLSRFNPRNLFCKLPACFNGQSYCQTYQGLLLKVSKLAYHLLFDSQSSVLVFDHDQKEIRGPCRLSEEEIQTCLDLGLLTQYKVLEKVTQRQKSISFVHKSHQEFFAAVFLWQTSDLKQLLDGFSDLDRALQIEKVLTFTLGMNPDVSREIANVVLGLRSSDDPKIKEYRESCLADAPQTAVVKHIQGVILTAIEESRRKGKRTPFLPQDIWMSCGSLADRYIPPWTILECSQSQQLSHVRSIYIRSPSNKEECKEIWQLVKNASQQLHKLVLYDCDINVSLLQEVVKRNKDSLQVIGLYDVRNFYLLDEATLTWIMSANSLALSGQTHYIELTHEQVEFVYKHLGQRPYTHVVLENLCCRWEPQQRPQQRLDLTSVRQLHTLELSNLPVQRLDLTSSRQLHTLKLRHLSVQRLDLTSSRQLHTLKLKDLSVQRLDLTSSRQLHTLILNDLQVQEVFAPDSLLQCEICEIWFSSDVVTASIVRSLRDARSLHTFICNNIRRSATVNQEIVTTLPQLEALREIKLRYIDMTCTQQHVFPDHMKALEKIELWGVTMRATQLRELLAAVPSHRVDVLLFNVTLTDYDRNDDIIEQTAASPRTEVTFGPRVTYEHDKCVVRFRFYHAK